MTFQDAADNTQTSRSRLLNAGKSLFARNGYEQTSTAAIAREAGSSESQLIRYFGGKAGLLEDLREVCMLAGGFPVLALGGIDELNSTEVLEAGAEGFAAIRYLNDFVNIKQ